MTVLWRRLKPTALALVVPLLLLAFWQVATTLQWTRLIPTPAQVGEYMVDFAWGGIYDDAYSATLMTHLLASMGRVYGGFALAALFALPIGLLIGRIPAARMLLDPFLQLMRPIPVTAWLPLSMILFGLGLAWFVIVVGEMTGVPEGLGAVIMDGRTLSRTELVICGMIVIGVAGYLSDRVVVAVGNRLLRWSPGNHG